MQSTTTTGASGTTIENNFFGFTSNERSTSGINPVTGQLETTYYKDSGIGGVPLYQTMTTTDGNNTVVKNNWLGLTSNESSTTTVNPITGQTETVYHKDSGWYNIPFFQKTTTTSNGVVNSTNNNFLGVTFGESSTPQINPITGQTETVYHKESGLFGFPLMQTRTTTDASGTRTEGNFFGMTFVNDGQGNTSGTIDLLGVDVPVWRTTAGYKKILFSYYNIFLI